MVDNVYKSLIYRVIEKYVCEFEIKFTYASGKLLIFISKDIENIHECTEKLLLVVVPTRFYSCSSYVSYMTKFC